MNDQLGFFDPQRGMELRDEGMARSGSNAPDARMRAS
jgi:hypothetical protein